MATTIVWTCDGGNGSHVSEGLASTRQHPTCQTGQGAFISIEIPDPPFQLSDLDSETITHAAGAGFIVMAVPLAAILGGKLILRAFTNRG